MSGPTLLTESATAEVVVVAAEKLGARTSVIALTAPCGEVFNTLADIEALPRWADGFCEVVYLDRGNWRGLTVLGELWLELEIDAHVGGVALLAGWQLGDGRRVEWRVLPTPDGGTRLSLRVEATSDDLQKRLFVAVETALWTLTARWGGGVRAGATEVAG